MYSTPYLPTIDPIIMELIGPLAIRWYSLSYVVGVLACWWHVKRLIKTYSTKVQDIHVDDFIPGAIISIIVGGRLGHVLFYDPGPQFYFAHPIEILKTYEGGMAIHGAMIGMAVHAFWFCRRHKIPFLEASDLTLSTVSFGIFFGRIANFINGELFGKITSKPWGVIFYSAEPMGVPRHPSQLYEATLEGAVLFFIIMYFIYKKRKLIDRGFITALWCGLYSIFRYICEFYREPDGIVDLVIFQVSTGQFLSIILFIFSIIIFCFRNRWFVLNKKALS